MGKLGIARRGLAPVVGNAGEYLVAGELLRRGVLAALTPKNSPGFDILATDRKKTVSIRVKTKLGASAWQWNAQSGDWRAKVFKERTREDFTILVDLARIDEAPSFYVVPTRKLEKYLQKKHKEWVETPGTRVKKRSLENKRRMLFEHSRFFKRIARNNWRDLGLRFSI